MRKKVFLAVVLLALLLFTGAAVAGWSSALIVNC